VSRRVFACRVDVATPEAVEQLAYQLGCFRAGNNGDVVGAVGVMLDRIARGDLKIVEVLGPPFD
jgi:hypothetical protein